MSNNEDSWDAIDWDKKIVEEQQQKSIPESSKAANFNFLDSVDENYFEINQELKRKKEMRKNQNTERLKRINFEKEEMPYSYKDLCRISSLLFHNMTFETYGNFNKFIATHEQDLSDETIVELIKIDVKLLQIPFVHHNCLLLKKLSTLKCFWSQVINLIEEYFKKNFKDPKYLLLIDLKGFLENIESLISYLLVNNLLQGEMKEIFLQLLATFERFEDDANFKKFHQRLLSFDNLINETNIFEIYPTISDLKNPAVDLEKNLIDGAYKDVLHYLKVQLPLIKEDYICGLRSAFDHLRTLSTDQNMIRINDATIFTDVQIQIKWSKVWNLNCPVITVVMDVKKKFFNGQLLCFTSTKSLDDLIIATVLKTSHIEAIDLVIEVIRTENISDIFNRDLIMVEAKAFFDPCYQVFTALKSLNNYNFPFIERILFNNFQLKSPSYEYPEYYDYKNYSLRISSFEDWKNCDLHLESLQLESIYASLSADFSICVGPPGTGKTFVGLEILNILLRNTETRILILTQTNNALDKFLIGALQFTNEIVRLGGQCKNEILAPYIAHHDIPYDSRNYIKKLQTMQRDTVSKLLKSNDDDHENIFRQISLHYRLVEEINQLNTFCNVNKKRVYGMTTSYAAHNSSINKMLKPEIILVEESSEILESHILSSLTKDTKQIIMIGDHHQLRPKISSYDLQKKYHFDISLFERLIMNKFPFVSLDMQLRMRPEFCDLVRETIYKNLKDSTNVFSYPNVKGIKKNLFCLNHKSPELNFETSKENPFEVKFLIDFYQKLLEYENDPNGIVILTSYAAQANKFRLKLTELSIPKVRVAVLDSYQGEESDIILLSLVRSNKGGDIGFLSMENRISVILSRAKYGFYICGNIDCFAKSSRLWYQIKGILEKHNAIGNSFPSDMYL